MFLDVNVLQTSITSLPMLPSMAPGPNLMVIPSFICILIKQGIAILVMVSYYGVGFLLDSNSLIAGYFGHLLLSGLTLKMDKGIVRNVE